MKKEDILVECPDCGTSCKFGDMAERNGKRLSRCPDCENEFAMSDSFLKHTVSTGGTWVLGLRTHPKKSKSSQGQQHFKQNSPAAPPAGAAKHAGNSSENSAPASRESGGNSDADALVRDAQRKAAASTDQADELPENPLLADAKRKAAEAGKQDDKESRDPLLADARKRAEA